MKVSLSDLLQTLRIAKVDSALVEIARAGAARLATRHTGFLHLVLEGEVLLGDEAGGRPVLLRAGDYAAMLGGRPQLLMTHPEARLSQSAYFQTLHSHDSPPTIRFGTGPRAARVLSGGFQLPVVNPLVRALPRRIVMRGESGGGGDHPGGFSIDSVERAAHGRGATTVLPSLLDTLFLQAVRSEASSLFGDDLRLSHLGEGFRVPLALSLIHSHPARRWTLASLAAEVGASRSTFAAEFRRTVGEPMMQYLTTLRMTRAANMLRWQPVTVADVAWAVGYENVAAFTRAFGRYFGRTPAAYQRSLAPEVRASVAGTLHWTPFLGSDDLHSEPDE